MNRTGYRRGGLLRSENDLVRKAVVVGAVLAASVVLFATLTVAWGPTPADPAPATGVAAYLEPMVKKGESKDSDGSDEDSKDSDEDSKDESTDSDEKSDEKSDKEHSGGDKDSDDSNRSSGDSGSSSTSSSARSAPSGGSSSGSSGAGPSGRNSSPGSGGAAPGTGATPNTGAVVSTAPKPPASPSGADGGPLARITCTREVTDEAGLKDALASAGPNDVICVKGGLGRGSAPSSTSTASPSATPSAKPRALPPFGSSSTSLSTSRSASPSAGPISRCGSDATCRQSNRFSGAAPSRAPSSAPSSAPPGAPRPSSASPGGGTASPTSGNLGSGNLGGPPGANTPTQENCTKQVEGSGLTQAVSAAAPGDRICVTGDSPERLEIKKGGTDGSPIQIIGDGKAAVKGITVSADHVLVEGFQVLNATAPGIQLTGNDITAQNNVVKRPTGGDYDGLRFFGNNLKILHNTISDINPGGGGAHADCMQTFTSDRPSSENVLIDGNRCEKIKNICLMAEGPGDVGDGGGGDGTSANWTISNNYCEFGAAQGIMIEAIQNVTINNNEFVGSADKAIGLDIGSTGAKVDANLLGTGVKAEVGMDSSSRKGYQGPDPQGGP